MFKRTTVNLTLVTTDEENLKHPMTKLAMFDTKLGHVVIDCDVLFLHRVYSEVAHDELSTLDTCLLMDEFEQPLKSKDDYLSSIQHIFTLYPNFEIYCKHYVVPFPADWPGWYYSKKLIAQGHDIGNILPEQGPFHVCLNAQEDAVLIFKFFFDRLYQYVFNKELPQKPKEFRISLCIVAALLG